jgi:hypothetical protein
MPTPRGMTTEARARPSPSVTWPGRRRPAEERAAWALSLRAVLVSRVIVWTAGVIAVAVFGRAHLAVEIFDPHGLTEPFHSSLANLLAAPAARWDSVWYLGIVQHGYFSRPSSAFFPLYPLLVRVAEPVFGSAVAAGVAISVAAMAGALYFLHRLARLDLSERAADLTVLLVAFFPTALFFSAVYTESLYLLLSVGAVYAARRDRWAYAGLAGAAAALSRPNGLLVALPLAILYLFPPGAPRRRIDRSAAWIAIVPLGAIAYLAYLGVIWHAPLAEYQAQADFGRSFGGPFGGVFGALIMLPGDIAHLAASTAQHSFHWTPVSSNQQHLIDLAFFVFATVGTWAGRRRLPLAYAAYAIALLAAAASYPHTGEPLEAVPRYMLVVFPAFMGWASVLADRRGAARVALATSSVLLVAFSALWGIWAWIA